MAEERKFYGQAEFAKGLEGVIACETTMGYVDGQAGKLIYRGYTIEDLAEHSNYEETSYLLLYGKLPTKGELDQFKKRLVGCREVPSAVIEILKRLPKDTHPMAALRTGISALGCMDPDADKTEMDNYTRIGINLISQIATVSAAVARIRKGKEPVKPDPSLDHTANFLYMATGQRPEDLATRVMDISLILHADHGMNASTFTSTVVASSLTDMYSAITAGIGSLKGPLHGGANEQVIKMLLEVGEPNKAEAYIENAMAQKQKIMGFGHRVYKAYDPRARILGKYSEDITKLKGMPHLYEIAKKIEDKVIAAYGERGIFPNVDYYSGTVYYAFGIEPSMFTIIFAVSRIAGWVGRVLEYVKENRIFRPRALYKGPMQVDYVSIDKR